MVSLNQCCFVRLEGHINKPSLSGLGWPLGLSALFYRLVISIIHNKDDLETHNFELVSNMEASYTPNYIVRKFIIEVLSRKALQGLNRYGCDATSTWVADFFCFNAVLPPFSKRNQSIIFLTLRKIFKQNIQLTLTQYWASVLFLANNSDRLLDSQVCDANTTEHAFLIQWKVHYTLKSHSLIMNLYTQRLTW